MLVQFGEGVAGVRGQGEDGLAGELGKVLVGQDQGQPVAAGHGEHVRRPIRRGSATLCASSRQAHAERTPVAQQLIAIVLATRVGPTR